MKYEKAKAEVVLFDNSDVITGSNCGQGSPKWGDSPCGNGSPKNDVASVAASYD